MTSRALCCALACVLLAVQAAATGPGFTIHRAELQRRGSDYVLNADIAYRFSKEAIEALENSVPLTLILHCRVDRERPFFWDAKLVDMQRRLRIRYHPLGQLYQMTFEESGNQQFSDPQSYASLRALLNALGTIRGLPVVPEDQIEAGATYRVSLSVALDIESLPLPLRPTAYVTPDWYLSSPTYRWSFARSE